MAFSSDQNVLCPSVEMIQKELLQMTCRVIQITDAMKIATVQVKGGATCTCTSGQTQGDVPLREAAEELSRAVDKLKEEVLMHALEGQGLFRHRRGRENTRDSAYESRNSENFYEYPMQESGEDKPHTSEDS
ncbi:uncharacterized protein LOC112572724 [Pomacea canaliculata]|uniref:uncharacterized protein LOC112572724 n=1 Tax=Pomacea canaliculata TaxID=400727 RepID=UPI000D72B66A|nr:uncharacterized protein LOC112572724 [Pomacea canaliculata]